MLIAQLSDTHVRPDGVRYHGVVDSNAGLHAAIDGLHALDRAPSLVLLTGDLWSKVGPRSTSRSEGYCGG